MKQYFLSYLILSLFVFSLSCKKESKEKKIVPKFKKTIILYWEGKHVNIKRKGEFLPDLTIKQQLYANDIIFVGKNSFLILQLGEIGIVHIPEKSKLKLLRLFAKGKNKASSIEKTILGLKEGSIYANISRLIPGVNFSIRTPLGFCSANATLKNSIFSVNQQKGKSNISLVYGSIKIRRKKANTNILLEKTKTATLTKKTELIKLHPLRTIEKNKLKLVSSFKIDKNIMKKDVRDIRKLSLFLLKRSIEMK